MKKEYAHTPTDDYPPLRGCLAFALRFEFFSGVLGSGIGPPTEQTWVGNPKLKGADRSVGSISVEVQHALLTLSLLRRSPPMQDVDRRPHKQGGNIRLRHDGSRLSELGIWMLGETPIASTRKRREYRSGYIAWTSSMVGKVSISPITLVENIDCSQVQSAQQCQF